MPITASSLVSGVGAALKSALCTTLQVTEPVGNFVVPLIRNAAAGNATVIGAAGVALIENIEKTRAYLNQFACENDPAALQPLSVGPQFSGGQCPGIYGVFAQINWTSQQGNPQQFNLQGLRNYGPIGPIRLEPSPSDPNVLLVKFTSHGQPPNARSVTPIDNTVIGIFNQDATISNVSVVPEGFVDNCGDLPPNIPDGSDSVGGTIDIDGVDENGDPISLPNEPYIIFNPTLNQNGDLVVNVTLPNLNICGTYTFGPGGGFVPQSCGPTNSPGPSPDDPPKGEGDPDPDEDYDDNNPPDEVEENETIIATSINSQAILENISQTQIPGGNGPIILFPRIGTISWKVEKTLKSQVISAWTRPIDIQSVNAWYEAPTTGRVVATSVVWQPNWKGKYQNIKSPYPIPCCGDAPADGEPPPA